MAFVDDQVLENLKQSADIVEIIQGYLPLKARGARFIGVCPFHQDSHPSMYVTPNLGIYKCFACGAGGDVLKFIQQYEKVEFYDAIKIAAEKSSFILPESKVSVNKNNQPNKDKKDKLKSAHTFATKHYKSILKKSPKHLQYLTKRGLSQNTIDEFELGLAPELWNSLLQDLTLKEFSKESLIESGLISQNQQGKVYDRFRNRLMIPIHDTYGQVVAFGGRALDPNENAKYLNSPETPLYHKSNILYGFYQARQAASLSKTMYLVEGYFDVIQLHQAGIKDCVAVSGTALTESHAKLLNRYVEKVVLMFDGDEAGIKAAHRSLPHLLPHNLEIQILLFPPGEDPDSIVQQQGVQGFKALNDKCLNWLDFILSDLPTEPSPEALSRKAQTVKDLLKLIKNPITKDVWAQKFADKTQISAHHLNTQTQQTSAAGSHPYDQYEPYEPLEEYDDYNQGDSSFSSQPAPIQHEKPKSTAKITRAELKLLHLLVSNSDLLDFARGHLDLDLFASHELAELADLAIEYREQTGAMDLKLFYQKISDQLKPILESFDPTEFTNPDIVILEYMQTVLKFELARLEARWKLLRRRLLQDPSLQKDWEIMFSQITILRKIKSHLIDSSGGEAEIYAQYLSIAHDIHAMVRQH